MLRCTFDTYSLVLFLFLCKENLVNDLKQRVADYEREISSKKDSNHNLSVQIESLKKQLEDAFARIAESNKVIANNQEVFYLLIY